MLSKAMTRTLGMVCLGAMLMSSPAMAEGAALFGLPDTSIPTTAPKPSMSVAEMFGISETNPYATLTPSPEPTPTPTPGPVVTPAPVDPAIADPFGIESRGAEPEAAAPIGDISPGSQVYVSIGMLPLRETTSRDAGVVAVAALGQKLTVSAAQGEWARIQLEDGRMAYCETSGLALEDPVTLSRQVFAQMGGVNIHAAPSDDAQVIRVLNMGDVVTLTAVTSDGLWSRVTDGANTGFARTVCLDEAPAGAGTPVWCAVGATPVMVNPDHWTEIMRLSFGQPVELAGYWGGSSRIARIRTSGGYVAYCASSALTAADPLTMRATVYAQAGGSILFERPWTDAATASVSKGEAMTALGVDATQTWTLVEYGGRRAFIPYIFIGTAGPGDNARVVTAIRDTPFYSAPGEIASTLPYGTRLYLVGGSAGIAAVYTIGDAGAPQDPGYVQWEDLKAG